MRRSEMRIAVRVVGSWIAAAALLALGLQARGLVRLNQPTAFALFESGSVRLISGAMGDEQCDLARSRHH